MLESDLCHGFHIADSVAHLRAGARLAHGACATIYTTLTEVILDALSTSPRGHLVFDPKVRKLENLLVLAFINTEGFLPTSIFSAGPESAAVVARVGEVVGFDSILFLPILIRKQQAAPDRRSLLLFFIELLHLNERCMFSGGGGNTRYHSVKLL